MNATEIPLSRPDITALEIEAVNTVLRTGRLSIGPMQEQFEQLVAARTNRRHAVACSSGTAGLHMALLALGVGPGDEVVTTPFSFIASANVILMVGAKPVFADICPKTLNMDPEKLRAAITPKTKAIIAVDCFGSPAYMDQYEQIAARYEIPIIEDSCEALGCSLKGRPAGSFGRVGIFGFYPNKQITTGEGGMIVTDDRRIADLCRSFRSQGRPNAGACPVEPGQQPSPFGCMTGSWLCFERLGYNYRLDELSAALGVAQMRRLDEIILKRQRVAEMYVQRLMTHKDLVLPTMVPDSINSWFVFVVRLATGYTKPERDRIIAGMRRHEVGCSDYFPCIHLQPHYRELGFAPGDFPIAESVSGRTLALPFYNDLSEPDVDFVCRTLDLMISRENLSRAG